MEVAGLLGGMSRRAESLREALASEPWQWLETFLHPEP